MGVRTQAFFARNARLNTHTKIRARAYRQLLLLRTVGDKNHALYIGGRIDDCLAERVFLDCFTAWQLDARAERMIYMGKNVILCFFSCARFYSSLL